MNFRISKSTKKKFLYRIKIGDYSLITNNVVKI